MIRVYEKANAALFPLEFAQKQQFLPEPVPGITWNFAPGMRVVHCTDSKSEGLVIGVMLDTVTVLWQKIPKYLIKFAEIAFPIIRRVPTPLIAQELCTVQPMSLPSGLIFYLDYTYGSGSKGTTTP